jgi:hypothetical protein
MADTRTTLHAPVRAALSPMPGASIVKIDVDTLMQSSLRSLRDAMALLEVAPTTPKSLERALHKTLRAKTYLLRARKVGQEGGAA